MVLVCKKIGKCNYIANLEKSEKTLNVMLVSINFKQVIEHSFPADLFSIFLKACPFISILSWFYPDKLRKNNLEPELHPGVDFLDHDLL